MAHRGIDRDFEAEGDAFTLSEAELINNDPPRLEKAKKAADKLAEEKKEQAVAMQKIADRKAGGGIAKSTSDKMFPNTRD